LIQVGSYKRSVSLPYTLVKREILKAEFDEGRLLIKFAKEVEDD
jgi:HSP20 family molecular chaperone IbpA